MEGWKREKAEGGGLVFIPLLEMGTWDGEGGGLFYSTVTFS